HALVQVQDGVQFLVELLAVGNLIVRGEVGVPVRDLDVAVPQDEVKIIVLILRVPDKDGRLEPLRQLYLHGLELGRQEVQKQPLRQPVGGERLFIPLQQGQNLLGLLWGGHGVQVDRKSVV